MKLCIIYSIIWLLSLTNFGVDHLPRQYHSQTIPIPLAPPSLKKICINILLFINFIFISRVSSNQDYSQEWQWQGRLFHRYQFSNCWGCESPATLPSATLLQRLALVLAWSFAVAKMAASKDCIGKDDVSGHQIGSWDWRCLRNSSLVPGWSKRCASLWWTWRWRGQVWSVRKPKGWKRSLIFEPIPCKDNDDDGTAVGMIVGVSWVFGCPRITICQKQNWLLWNGNLFTSLNH